MFRDRIQPWVDWIKRVITEPRSELTRWQRAARFCYDLGRCGARQLQQDRAPQMAGALAFRTLFGLLPVLVVGTVLVRAFRGFEQFHGRITQLFSEWGLDAVTVAMEENREVETLSDFLLGLLRQAEQLNFTAIGWVGMAVLIYSAIGLMVTIEGSFNTIYRAPAGRSWTRRLPMYWTVLTLGPAAIGLTMFVNARFLAWIDTVETGQWLLSVAPNLLGFLVIWLLMLAVYKLVPNTNVSLHPALIGALVTAILLEIGRLSLGAYLQNLLSLRQLYGSLGLIPLFMFWVYIMWLVVLFGLEVSATLQMLGGRKLDEIETKTRPTGLVDPASVVLVMEVIAERFEKGTPANARSIADVTELPETTVARMLEDLVGAGLLHPLEREGNAVTLARPPEQITADELVEIGYRMVETGGGGRRSALVQRLRSAQKSLAAQATLASVRTSDRAAPRAGQADAPA